MGPTIQNCFVPTMSPDIPFLVPHRKVIIRHHLVLKEHRRPPRLCPSIPSHILPMYRLTSTTFPQNSPSIISNTHLNEHKAGLLFAPKSLHQQPRNHAHHPPSPAPHTPPPHPFCPRPPLPLRPPQPLNLTPPSTHHPRQTHLFQTPPHPHPAPPPIPRPPTPHPTLQSRASTQSPTSTQSSQASQANTQEGLQAPEAATTTDTDVEGMGCGAAERAAVWKWA